MTKSKIPKCMTQRRKFNMSDKEKKSQISVRLDPEIDEMLERIKQKTGQNKSRLINRILKQNSADIIIIDSTKIAASLFDIRRLLKQMPDDDSVKAKVEAACDLLAQELYDLFDKGGDSNGNSESDKC